MVWGFCALLNYPYFSIQEWLCIGEWLQIARNQLVWEALCNLSTFSKKKPKMCLKDSSFPVFHLRQSPLLRVIHSPASPQGVSRQVPQLGNRALILVNTVVSTYSDSWKAFLQFQPKCIHKQSTLVSVWVILSNTAYLKPSDSWNCCLLHENENYPSAVLLKTLEFLVIWELNTQNSKVFFWVTNLVWAFQFP